MMDNAIANNDLLDKMRNWFAKYWYWIFQLLFLVVYALVLFYDYCFVEVGISNDSARYLRETQAILKGYWFNCDGIAGGNAWFNWFPIGYPVAIALVSALFGISDVFIASKVLSVLMVLCLLLFFAIEFKEDSCFFSLILFDLGIIRIFGFAWSETVFIPILVWYTYCLYKVNCTENPRNMAYLSLFFSQSMLFFVRYFGIFAVICTGVTILLKMIVQYKRKKVFVSISNAKLVVVCIIGGGVDIAYLAVNRFKSGLATGVARKVFVDDVKELTVNLFESLYSEVTNVFMLNDYPLFKYFSIEAKIAIVILVFFVVIFITILRHKIDMPFCFIFVGMFYDVTFLVIRYHSSMDRFNYRFWGPGTMLVLIGVFSICREKIKLNKLKTYIVAVISCLLLFTGISIMSKLLEIGYENSAYAIMKAEILQKYDEIPSNSVVINFTEANDRVAESFRPDVLFNTNSIKNIEGFNKVCEKYNECTGIYISKTEIFNRINPDNSVSDDFKEYLASYSQSEQSNFIRIVY